MRRVSTGIGDERTERRRKAMCCEGDRSWAWHALRDEEAQAERSDQKHTTSVGGSEGAPHRRPAAEGRTAEYGAEWALGGGQDAERTPRGPLPQPAPRHIHKSLSSSAAGCISLLILLPPSPHALPRSPRSSQCFPSSLWPSSPPLPARSWCLRNREYFPPGTCQFPR